MKNVLVFPCGSEIGLDIYSSVYASSHFHLIGGSSVEDHGKFVYEDYIGGIPFIDSPDFVPAISKIVKERHVDVIYPTMDRVIVALKEQEETFGCRVVSSKLKTAKICLSKEETYRELEGAVRIPKVFKNAEDVKVFPVFIKPKIGYGSWGAKKVDDKETLYVGLSGKESEILILEYLPGKEYTVDCFTDKVGNLLYSSARSRNRIRNGISVNTSFVASQDEFEVIARAINSRIEFRGAWFYQVKRAVDGELCLLEVAARLGGSSLLSRAVGVNFALLTLFDIFDVPVSILKNHYDVILDRALDNKYSISGLHYSTVYLDYDDCLVMHKSTINVDLIKLVFKCINDGVKVVLLSKHIGDLHKELAGFRLDGLFDEIVQLEPSDDKSLFIKDKEAIFIDDSFAERKNVKDKTGIPVFSPEMVDVLL